MLKSLKVRNLKGFNYDIDFSSGNRKNNIIELQNDIKLFATYHVTGEQVFKALDVFNVLIIIRNPNTFKAFCDHLVKDEVYIEVHYLILEIERSIYVEKSYSILFDCNGLIEEYYDGDILPKNLLGSYYIEIPEYTFSYFKTIFYFNLTDKISMDAIRRLFINASKISGFLKFFNSFMFTIMKYEPVEVVAIDNDISVFDKAGNKTNFDLMDSDFRTLCYLSWAIHINFLKTGVLVINNIDKGLSPKKLELLLELYNDPTCMSMNPCQFIFSTTYDQTPFTTVLFPEQEMTVQKVDAKYFVCSTKTFK